MEKLVMAEGNQREKLSLFKPNFYRIYNQEDREKFELILSIPGIMVHDAIMGQLKEYVKYKTPSKKYTDGEYTVEIEKQLGKLTKEEYGVWVYYPWSNRVVHILDRDEFIDLRTSRNQYKITKAERDVLAKKKIGVIGLSVGQSVSVTIALERICGELRLADFDDLELNNLNRIRTGLHNLGLLKVYAVAREIAEIDPFLNVKCFPKGLNEENMDEFFLGDGKLDLLIEESDGFDIKILSRYKARSLQIPVVMEASDRCTLDVERFDLEPGRSILHGLVDHLDIATLKSLKTTEEKIPYMLDVLGIETSSLKLKASMLEIDQTINTWPQLASAVTMGGGITADVSRRLLLNEFTASGRYHVDIEELIGDGKSTRLIHEPPIKSDDFPALTIEEMRMIANSIKRNELSSIDIKDIEKIVEAAIMAPSAGNNQPWKWLFHDQRLFLFHDKKQSFSWSDKLDLVAYISLGAAIENVIIQSEALGYLSEPQFFPNEYNNQLVAVFGFTKINIKPKTDLYKYLYTRNTNRKKGDSEPIEIETIEKIQNICESISNASFYYTSDKVEIEKIALAVSKTERIRFLHPKGHEEFFNKEIKWRDHKGDILEGLDIKTLELGYTDEVGLKVASDKRTIHLLNEWKGGSAFEKISYKAIMSSSGIGLISMPSFSNENWIMGGRAVQRTWLTATKSGLAFHPISAPLFFHLQLLLDENHEFNGKDAAELRKLYDDIADVFPDLHKNKGVFMFRLSKAGEPSLRSLRKPISDLLSI